MAISERTLTLLFKLTVIFFPSNKETATNPALVWVTIWYKPGLVAMDKILSKLMIFSKFGQI
jgi:hypothetical protein